MVGGENDRRELLARMADPSLAADWNFGVYCGWPFISRSLFLARLALPFGILDSLPNRCFDAGENMGGEDG